MDTSRIIINTIDNSNYSTETSTAVAGYTVVKAPKGPCRPKKISAGGTAKLKDVYGVSSSEYPELFEVETFNKSYDVYVSAPYGTNTTVPVAYVTADGVFAGKETINYTTDLEDVINSEKEAEEVDDLDWGIKENKVNVLSALSSIKYVDSANDNNGSNPHSGILISLGARKLNNTDTITFIFKNTNYKNDFTTSITSNAWKIEYDNKKVGDIVTFDEKAKKYTTQSDLTSNTENLFLFIYGNDDANFALTTSRVADLKADISKIAVYEVLEKSDIRAVILPKYPSIDRTLHISFSSFNENTGYSSKKYSSRNILKMSVYEEGAFHNASHPISFTGTLDSGDTTTACFNSNNEDYSNQELVYVHVIKPFTSEDNLNFTTLTSYQSVILDGGTRTFFTKKDTKDNDVDDLKTLHDKGWQYAIDEEFQDVSIFFSSSKNMLDEKDSVFFNIASSGPQLAKYSGFIFNETPDAVTDNLEILGYGREYWNICNLAVIDLDKGSRIFSPLTGARALMQARIIDNRYGGLAPMWENVQGMGGQLTMVSPYRMKYKYTKEQLTILDNHNYNPIIMDRQYGTMVVGQRTCQSGSLTDWSYIGHACAFMTCIKEIRNNVMIPQIGKANNPYYRTLRAEQVNQILRKRIEGNNRIWAEGVVDTSTADGVNDANARKNLRFIIQVRVKVDIFSEYVQLDFFNEDQSSTVSTSEV